MHPHSLCVSHVRSPPKSFSILVTDQSRFLSAAHRPPGRPFGLLSPFSARRTAVLRSSASAPGLAHRISRHAACARFYSDLGLFLIRVRIISIFSHIFTLLPAARRIFSRRPSRGTPASHDLPDDFAAPAPHIDACGNRFRRQHAARRRSREMPPERHKKEAVRTVDSSAMRLPVTRRSARV